MTMEDAEQQAAKDFEQIQHHLGSFCEGLRASGDETTKLQAVSTAAASALRLATDLQDMGILTPSDGQALEELNEALLCLIENRALPHWIIPSKVAFRRSIEVRELGKRAYMSAACDFLMMDGCNLEDAARRVGRIVGKTHHEIIRHRQKLSAGEYKDADFAKENYHQYVKEGKNNPKGAFKAIERLLIEHYMD